MGQGALCIEIRAEEKQLHDMVKYIEHSESAVAVSAERAFLRRLGGGCRVPIAALGYVESGKLNLVGLVARADGRKVIRSDVSGEQADAENLGNRLAEILLGKGAESVLEPT